MKQVTVTSYFLKVTSTTLYTADACSTPDWRTIPTNEWTIVIEGFYSVFIVVVQLTSNGFALCMFVNCKIMKFRHAEYDVTVIYLFTQVNHDSTG